jgi:hypothetical protein
VLFEIAPLDAYRLVVQVDERDVNDVAVGQHGHLRLAPPYALVKPLPSALGQVDSTSCRATGAW